MDSHEYSSLQKYSQEYFKLVGLCQACRYIRARYASPVLIFRKNAGRNPQVIAFYYCNHPCRSIALTITQGFDRRHEETQDTSKTQNTKPAHHQKHPLATHSSTTFHGRVFIQTTAQAKKPTGPNQGQGNQHPKASKYKPARPGQRARKRRSPLQQQQQH